MILIPTLMKNWRHLRFGRGGTNGNAMPPAGRPAPKAVFARPPRVAPALFEVADATSQRADLARRREVKYTFMHPDLEALRKLLEQNGHRQVFNQPVSTVRSVYFDDAKLSACQANLDGLGRRRKLRLRWYDAPLPGHECFLEIKWRDNRVTGKHRLRLRSAEAIGTLPYRAILMGLEQVVPETYLPAMELFTEPVLLVEYQREHFVSPDGRMRVTLDYDLVYFDQTGRPRISAAFGRRQEGFAVLEGKIPTGCERELRRFLCPFAARVSRCSKYVNGCQAFGLV